MDGLRKFLVEEKGFNPDRVESGIVKLKKALTTGSQTRMDSFFKVIPSSVATAATSSASGVKRKASAPASKPGPKKK